MRHFLLLLLTIFLSGITQTAQAASAQVDVTGNVTALHLFGEFSDLDGNTERFGGVFNLDSPEVIGLEQIADLRQSTGSMMFTEGPAYGSDLNYELTDCAGLLRFACLGPYLTTTSNPLSQFGYGFNNFDFFWFQMSFSPSEYNSVFDAEWGWSNTTGSYYIDYMRVIVAFDSFLVDGQPFPGEQSLSVTSMPVAPALPLAVSAMGLLFGLRRLTRRG